MVFNPILTQNEPNFNPKLNFAFNNCTKRDLSIIQSNSIFLSESRYQWQIDRKTYSKKNQKHQDRILEWCLTQNEPKMNPKWTQNEPKTQFCF